MDYRKTFKIVTMLLTGYVLVGCNQDKNSVLLQQRNQELEREREVIIPSSSLDWEESFHYGGLRSSTSGNYNYSTEFFVRAPGIYVGCVMPADSLAALSFGLIPGKTDPLTLTLTIPGYYFDEIPFASPSNMRRTIAKAIRSPEFRGTQLQGFEYDYRSFESYNELKLAFGADVNIGSVFKIDISGGRDKISHTSGLFARLVQKNFAVIMDYPEDGNIFLDNDLLDKNRHLSPVYISSITYGRTAIIAIESDFEYDKVRAAFTASLTLGKDGGKLTLDTTSEEILRKSNIRMIVSGGRGNQVAELVNGFDEFKDFIIKGGEFTKDDYGVPISFTANWVHSNSMYRTKFIVK